MREIKFRAWWKDAELMADVVALRDGEVTFHVPLMPNSLGQEYEVQSLDEGQYELMQYTGLKDKNGKEIYEGDIIKYAWRGSSDEVKIDPYWFHDWVEYGSEPLEVIGNIYENPELLKSK